jgi:hypothetical protein
MSIRHYGYFLVEGVEAFGGKVFLLLRHGQWTEVLTLKRSRLNFSATLYITQPFSFWFSTR